jgi:hypothetical protein
MHKIIPVLALVLSTACLSVQAASDDSASEYTILPGIGIGAIKLGMDRLQITETMGKRDGKYSLPSGIKVEYAEWKDPDKTSTIRVFFSPAGKAVQFAFEADKPATADGISTHSSLEDVTKQYPSVKRLQYQAKTGQVDYYDDIKKGIAFEFKVSDPDEKTKKFLYAILVHRPGKHVIPELDGHPLCERL